MATESEVRQRIDGYRRLGDEEKAIALEQWLEERLGKRKADQVRRGSSNYLEDIVRSAPGAAARGLSYISQPFTKTADLLTGELYSKGTQAAEQAIGDPTRHQPQTGPGRLSSALISGVAGAAVPVGAQGALAAKGITAGVPMAKELGLAGLGALSGQAARETLPEQMPGREAVATGLELATPMAASALGTRLASKGGALPGGVKKALTPPTASSAREAARKAVVDKFGSEQLLFNLEHAKPVRGVKQPTALAGKSPELLAAQNKAIASTDIDTSSITRHMAALQSKYIEALSESDIHTIPQAHRHIINDLSLYLNAHLAKGKAYSHKLAMEFYKQNKVDVDAVPGASNYFKPTSNLILKNLVEQDVNDFKNLRAMGLSNSLIETNVWRKGNALTQLEELLARAKTPRQALAVKRQAHKSLVSSVFGDSRDLGNMDDAFIRSSYDKLINVWNAPGGVDALKELYNPEQLIGLHFIVEHMTRAKMTPAQGIALPEMPNKLWRNTAKIAGAHGMNRIYSWATSKLGGKSLGGALAAGGVGSSTAQQKIMEKTVGPFNAEMIRFLDDPDYAIQVTKDYLGKNAYEAMKNGALPQVSVTRPPLSPGRFTPGLTPGGYYEYEKANAP
jgi:hypothetical protein